jgi:hypothetical protein
MAAATTPSHLLIDCCEMQPYASVVLGVGGDEGIASLLFCRCLPRSMHASVHPSSSPEILYVKARNIISSSRIWMERESSLACSMVVSSSSDHAYNIPSRCDARARPAPIEKSLLAARA